MVDRRDDFLDSRVAERLKRFEVHGWEVHLVEDYFPIIGPKFDKHSVEQLEGVSGIHNGFPVFISSLRPMVVPFFFHYYIFWCGIGSCRMLRLQAGFPLLLLLF